MASPAPNQPLQDETYLPDQDAAEIIDFLAALRPRPTDGRAAPPADRAGRPQCRAARAAVRGTAAGRDRDAGLAVTDVPHHLLLSTQEAADLLRISFTILVGLLETGATP